MYDSWAVFDSIAETVFLGKTKHGFSCEFEGIEPPAETDVARNEILSFAMYRLLTHRFTDSPGATFALQRFDELFSSLGYDSSFTSTNFSSGSYAALGNYLGEKLIEFGNQDRANEKQGYSNQYYQPINEPLTLEQYEEFYELTNPNRWQPLAFESFVDKAGIPYWKRSEFLNPEWGQVKPCAKIYRLQILKMLTANLNDRPPNTKLGSRRHRGSYKWHLRW